MWDFTCPDTVAPTHLLKNSQAAGSAALAAEVRKTAKYTALSQFHIFVPVATQTFGVWGPQASLLISDLGVRVAAVTGEQRSTT